MLHCFTGTEDEAKKYVDMGFYIGLTGGTLTFLLIHSDGDVRNVSDYGLWAKA